MSENGEIYTAGNKFYTAAGSDGIDKFHLCVGGVTARDKQGVHATVNCEASPPPVTENCGRVTISYFHIVTARVSSTFCDSLYHLL